MLLWRSKVILNTKQEIIEEIKTHIQGNGGPYRSWYVGITKSARDALLDRHKAEGDLFICRQAYSSYVAIEVRGYFVEKLRTDGDTDGRDDTAETVYAYRKKTCASDCSWP